MSFSVDMEIGITGCVRTRLIALFCMCLSGVFALEPQGELVGPFEVLRVVDGDTVELETLGTIRLIGIDTPEKFNSTKLEHDAEETGRSKEAIQIMGEAASTFAENLLRGQRVWVELGVEERDRYGRVLAYLYFENPDGVWEYTGQHFTQANLAIIASGWAEPLTIPPNVAYANLYLGATREARETRRGMWAELVAEEPVEIACILYNPDGRDEGNELVTLYALENIDVTDWRIADDDGDFIILEGLLEAGFEYDFSFDGSSWGNSGDVAFLYNAQGQLVDELSYEGGGQQACR